MPPTDDEVLQLFNDIGADASDIVLFRSVRYAMSRGVPRCCIMFQVRLMDRLPLIDKHELAGQLVSGEFGDFAPFIIDCARYFDECLEAGKKLGIKLTYCPCPACYLAKKFVDVPLSRALVEDEANYPACDPNQGNHQGD